jgi:hypothetical protein
MSSIYFERKSRVFFLFVWYVLNHCTILKVSSLAHLFKAMPRGVPSEKEVPNKQVHELTQEELAEGMNSLLKYDKKDWSALDMDECILSTYAPAKSGGENEYRQGRIKGTKYFVHRLACFYKYRKEGRHIPVEPKLEVSHLCHKRQCYNPKHLVFEDGFCNKSRICCELFKKTSGYRCPHEPTCFDAKPCNS